MLTQEQVIVLLGQADLAWRSVRAVARQWQRHDLVTEAFNQHVAALAAAQPTAVYSVHGNGREVDPIIELVLAVATDQHGRRRRADV